MMKKKILILGTGGTIACTKTENGLVPGNNVSKLLQYIPEIADLCDMSELQLANIDSTNLQPEHWLLIAERIRSYYDMYDGFLVLHGTDTMAYTAAALSYLIQNSKKPIVITGSQFPMEQEDTDARDNVRQSIHYLTREDACDISIVFADKIIPGGRARKVRSHSLDAFECVGYLFDPNHRKQPVTEKPVFYQKWNPHVMIWKLIPGLQPDILLKTADLYDGIVIEGFGLGGLPDTPGCDYFPIVEKLIHMGKIVAITTQVPIEGSDMSVYEVGVRYKKNLPILEGKTMTPESMAVKLMWILGNARSSEEVVSMFYRPINYDLV